MRWFTRAWQDGELTEAEAAAREGAYLEYVRSIEAHVAPHVRAFAAPTDDHASVDDALVDRIEIDHETSRIHLRLLNGNLQAG